MNKWFSWPAVILLLLVITFNAEASMFYQVDIDTSNMDKLSLFDNGTYTWSFDIEKEGFDSSSQTIESASLELSLSDDAYDSWFSSYEGAGIYYDQSTAKNWLIEWFPDWLVVGKNISGTYVIDIDYLDSLNQDGTLSVTLQALLGDFYIDSIKLNVWATDISTPVGGGTPVPTPESSTLLLLGIGLLAIVKVIRLKQV